MNELCPIGIVDTYVDADHVGDATRKSTTGFVVRMFNTPVMWSSKLQDSIADTTEDYIALNKAVKAVLFLVRLTKETIILNVFPVTMYEDNYAAFR